ncbi:MAG: class I SAM-dependent methyltransferase [Flavobacteriaceae bacterium]|nr:class I SAM-dependent methyltransferase [Flavobacteriaceae bacterium]
MTKSNNLKREFQVKDHAVSQETFRLIFNHNLELYQTVPTPSPENLPKYYESQDYISHTHQGRNLFEKVYGLIRAIAIKRKIKLIDSFALKGRRLLDYGCGTGDFLQACSKNGWDIVGVEPNPGARKIANSKTENRIHTETILDQLADNSIDVITLWHVLEHIPDYDAIISKFSRILAHDGRILVAVPNYNSYDAEYYKEYWAAFDVPRHLWHFSKTSISKIFQNHGYSICKIHPMKFDSYYVSLLSEKYKGGKMKYFSALYRGWLSNQKARRSGEYSSLIYVLKPISD